jgi:hypothetical protein
MVYKGQLIAVRASRLQVRKLVLECVPAGASCWRGGVRMDRWLLCIFGSILVNRAGGYNIKLTEATFGFCLSAGGSLA